MEQRTQGSRARNRARISGIYIYISLLERMEWRKDVRLLKDLSRQEVEVGHRAETFVLV